MLTIFSVKTTTDETNGMYIAQIDEPRKELLRNIMNEMNIISHTVENIDKEITVEDEDGNETTITVTETVLTVNNTYKPYTEMMSAYGFNSSQREQAEALLSDESRILWAQLLGGYMAGSGQIIISGADWIPIGRFSYPLPDSYSITSLFGYREDPFTGEISYHSGLDIGAPERTPILAADGGTVIVTNAVDSWGGGYGYHVIVEHSDGYKTLYAHCFGIAVITGQQIGRASCRERVLRLV